MRFGISQWWFGPWPGDCLPYLGLENNQKLGCLISVEGGHSLDNSLAVLRTFYLLGARSLTLTHTCSTPW